MYRGGHHTFFPSTSIFLRNRKNIRKFHGIYNFFNARGEGGGGRSFSTFLFSRINCHKYWIHASNTVDLQIGAITMRALLPKGHCILNHPGVWRFTRAPRYFTGKVQTSHYFSTPSTASTAIATLFIARSKSLKEGCTQQAKKSREKLAPSLGWRRRI